MLHHLPVLADELLQLAAGARRVVDGTLGDGGHAERFLATGASVLGIDRDPEALERARTRLGSRAIRYLAGSAFDPAMVTEMRDFGPDFILLDLGVSSRQLDDPVRGFTFRPGAFLDMRMSQAGPTAADLLQRVPEEELASWFRDFADEPQAVRLARVIGRRRARHPLRTSDDLVNAIRETLGSRAGPADFARLFQAVRIAVNDEIGGLARGLPLLRDVLVDRGTLAVISYHSGEDRTVKHTFREWSRRCICPPGFPICRCRGRPLGRLITRRAIIPGPAELERNPRARSAHLRAFQVLRSEEEVACSAGSNGDEA